MSLEHWESISWIRKAERSAAHVDDLLGVVERELKDASITALSADNRFVHAYNAARTLCDIALHAAGYGVPKNTSQHERTINSLQFTLGSEWEKETDFFDRCRRERNQSLYDKSDVVRTRDADELLESARRLNEAVRKWLKENHADLV